MYNFLNFHDILQPLNLVKVNNIQSSVQLVVGFFYEFCPMTKSVFKSFKITLKAIHTSQIWMK